MTNGWYKIAQGEFIGPGSPVSTNSGNYGNIVQQPGNARLEEGNGAGSDQAYRNPSGDGRNSPFSENKRSCKDMNTGKVLMEGERCPRCREVMVKDEFSEKMDGTYQYSCKHTIKGERCGYSSYSSGWDIKVKRKSRLKHKKSSGISPFVTAASPATPYNNPANTPYGNLDISEDVRVIPWSKIEPDFRETWDSQKQKKKLDYKIKKVKDKDGKIKFIKVKDSAAGSGIQPSNTYTQKGDLRKQHRYKQEEGVPKGNSTNNAWPNNRGADPSDGWYGSESVIDKNQFNADMRNRFQLWEQYIRERDTSISTLTKPF